ncbi:hypothetical protein ONV78_08465 [Hahella sp. CR1]|uniref:hypothetical protein n=1 Tax=Hahella sp. CR1 TaxID=2992807 RepID=UPI002442CC56|nr:hypothetical protein [Hahella sp. CR1]MDG9667761.1 hypothetical protein [Hahella sp. CR1]
MPSPEIFAALGAALIGFSIALWAFRTYRGDVKLAQPSYILLDQDTTSQGKRISEVRLRTALFSASKRGVVIDYLTLWLRRGEEEANFSIWAYLNKQCLRESGGLLAPKEGVVLEHHFLTETEGPEFEFKSGPYEMVILAKPAGSGRLQKLSSLYFVISDYQAQQMRKSAMGLCLRWDPKHRCYQSDIESNLKPSVTPLVEEHAGGH